MNEINNLDMDSVKREADRTKAMDKMRIEEDKKFYKDLDEQWFNNMISGAKDSQTTPITVKDINGNDLEVKITYAVIEYMIENRFMILTVGKDLFKQFLLLCSNGQDLAALKLIYSNIDTAVLINQYKENAVKLAEIYKQDQDTKAFWLQLATTLGGKIISLALGSLIP
jgi:predicted CoA-binding protein